MDIDVNIDNNDIGGPNAGMPGDVVISRALLFYLPGLVRAMHVLGRSMSRNRDFRCVSWRDRGRG